MKKSNTAYHILTALLLAATLSARAELVTDYVTTTNAAATNYFLGSVGIGTTNPVQQLDIAGNLNVNGTGTFTAVTGDGSGLTGITAAQIGAVANTNAHYLGALTDASQFATAAQGAKADSALQPTGDGSQLTGISAAQVGALPTGSLDGLSNSISIMRTNVVTTPEIDALLSIAATNYNLGIFVTNIVCGSYQPGNPAACGIYPVSGGYNLKGNGWHLTGSFGNYLMLMAPDGYSVYVLSSIENNAIFIDNCSPPFFNSVGNYGNPSVAYGTVFLGVCPVETVTTNQTIVPIMSNGQLQGAALVPGSVSMAAINSTEFTTAMANGTAGRSSLAAEAQRLIQPDRGAWVNVQNGTAVLWQATCAISGGIACWNFDDGTGKDSFGMNNDASLVGSPAMVNSRSGLAMRVTATNYAVIDSPGLNINGWTGITVSVWVRPVDTGLGSLFGGGSGFTTYGDILTRGADSVGGIYLICAPSADDWDSCFGVTLGPTNGISISFPSFTPSKPPYPVIGNWYHLVGTYDGHTLCTYVNGVLDNTTNVDMPGSTLWEPVGCKTYIGASYETVLQGWSDTYFSGDFDEVAIWNRGLSVDEVSQLYATGSLQQNNFPLATIADITKTQTIASNALSSATTALQPTGNGSQLSGITATQVGADPAGAAAAVQSNLATIQINLGAATNAIWQTLSNYGPGGDISMGSFTTHGQ